jgi:hypothetical protein
MKGIKGMEGGKFETLNLKGIATRGTRSTRGAKAVRLKTIRLLGGCGELTGREI